MIDPGYFASIKGRDQLNFVHVCIQHSFVNRQVWTVKNTQYQLVMVWIVWVFRVKHLVCKLFQKGRKSVQVFLVKTLLLPLEQLLTSLLDRNSVNILSPWSNTLTESDGHEQQRFKVVSLGFSVARVAISADVIHALHIWYLVVFLRFIRAYFAEV